jgi:hypothetical protein
VSISARPVPVSIGVRPVPQSIGARPAGAGALTTLPPDRACDESPLAGFSPG